MFIDQGNLVLTVALLAAAQCVVIMTLVLLLIEKNTILNAQPKQIVVDNGYVTPNRRQINWGGGTTFVSGENTKYGLPPYLHIKAVATPVGGALMPARAAAAA